MLESLGQIAVKEFEGAERDGQKSEALQQFEDADEKEST
jgi:hypothetical protein